jgi:hypothetical protein
MGKVFYRRFGLSIGGSPYLDLSFTVALREDLLEASLEDADIVVDDSLLFCRMFLAHDTY